MKRIICLIIFLMNLLLLSSCTGTDGTSGATESRYQELEIREYNGVKLDPSIGLRDNSIKGIQHVDISMYTLKVTGLVKNSVSLSYNDVLAMTAYEKLITLHCVEGWDATVLWKGVLLKDIIDKASAEGTANTVIFHSVDGYTTSLPLKDIIDKKIILAYSSNRITLPAELGYPFIVVAEDKLGYKWARWVTEIELSDNPNYKGYWETRGFDNNADVK
jgi:DMSO/TMAO reductase YedYZ molybdopterin-dependent catalytic subunit